MNTLFDFRNLCVQNNFFAFYLYARECFNIYDNLWISIFPNVKRSHYIVWFDWLAINSLKENRQFCHHHYRVIIKYLLAVYI